MKRRVCVLLPAHWSATLGGAEYQAKLLTEHLLARYDVELFYLTTRSAADYRSSGYEIVRFSSADGIRRYGSFFDAFRLYAALRRLRPDVIYQQVGCAHTGIAAFYAERFGCDMVWRVSSDRSVVPVRLKWWRPHHFIERWFLEYGIRRAPRVCAQTRAQQRHLAERFGRDDAVLIPNFHLDARLPAQHGVGRKRVVWIGNLKQLKNPAAFVRLAERCRDRADVEFVMIGAAVDASRWTADTLAAIRAVANVRYLGALDQDAVSAVLEQAHVLVNTSDYEGFPNTFIQAWLRCVPVVSLRVDPDELLSVAGLGLLAGSEDALQRCVGRLLDEPGTAQLIGRRCRDYARQAHSMDNADKLARLLRLQGIDRRRSLERLSYAAS